MSRKTGKDREIRLASLPSVQDVCNEVRIRLNMSMDVSDERVYSCIDEVILEVSRGRHMGLEYKVHLRENAFNSLRRLDVLQNLLEDDEITEIMINSHDNIFVEKRGMITKTDLKFESVSRYEDIVQQIVSSANRIVNQTTPIVDARLKDGSRVNVILSPVAIDGTTMTIRKFSDKAWNMQKLVEKGALSYRMAEFFRLLVCSRYNIIVSGSTGSGKTTLLNLLSEFIPDSERIVTIEDSAELNLRNIPNIVRLETKNANVEGEHEIKIGELIKASLRMRPDRIIVGEVRGEEAFFMINAAMNTGHDGSLSTGHANSTQDMLSRLETMVLQGADGLPLEAIRQQISSAVDIIIHLSRLRDKTRKTMEICEVLGYENGQIVLNPLYVFEEDENSTLEKVSGSLNRTKNKMQNVYKLQLAGIKTEI